MKSSAPKARVVCQLTGAKAPTEFFNSLAKADEHVCDVARAELLVEENAELRCRIDELTAERDEWRQRALAACPHEVTP